MLIVVEGMDASGKATLTKALEAEIPNAVRLSFPEYETELGDMIRRNLQNEWRCATEFDSPLAKEHGVKGPSALVLQCLMTVNRLELTPLIQSFLAKGQVVILDRYWHSGVAYGQADGLDATWLELIHSTLPQPHLALYLDIPAKVSLERRPERRDRYESQPGLMETVRENYLNLWTRKQQQRQEYVILDANHPPEVVKMWATDEIKRVAQKLMRAQEQKKSSLVLPYGRN